MTGHVRAGFTFSRMQGKGQEGYRFQHFEIERFREHCGDTWRL